MVQIEINVDTIEHVEILCDCLGENHGKELKDENLKPK